jgi:hypothetical protein
VETTRLEGESVRSARILGVVLAVVLIAVPMLAVNKPHRGECRRLSRQIARYERDVRWADQRGAELWEDASEDRTEHLTARRAHLCPEYRKRNPLAEAADFVAAAAKAAAPYFIPGMELPGL